MPTHPLHIAYFSNQFVDLEGHGLARYSRQLHESLLRVTPRLEVTPVATWSSIEPDGVKHLQKQSGLRLLPWGRRWTPLAWTFLNAPPIEHWLGDSIDVVHAVSLGFPIATRKPFVVTIHDIGPLTHTEFFTNTSPWIMKQSLRRALRKAAALICVSQSTADELESHVGRDLSTRIHIVHEGVSPLFFHHDNSEHPARLPNMPPPDVPYILATGKISPRKNVARTIEALAKLVDVIPHHLLLVGASGWEMDEVLKRINNPKVAGRVHMTGYVSDEQLRALYASASLYVHPSLYEGFGLTVLEAMAAGCPVVTSNVYSLPEVAGKAALLVNPHNVDEIAEAIRAICQDTSLEKDLITRGLAHAKIFTWDECARQVAAIYASIA